MVGPPAGHDGRSFHPASLSGTRLDLSSYPPLFVRTETGQGRVETRCLHAFAIEPLRADFPFARSLIVLCNTRLIKKTNQSTTESHYYLSSALSDQHRPAQWLALIRGHWAGVEVRNHWRRDVLFGEDGPRSRNPNLLAILAEHFPETSGSAIVEQLSCNPDRSFQILCH